MNQIEFLDKTYSLITFVLLFGLNLVTGCLDLSCSVCHVKNFKLPCLNSIGFPH